MTRYTSPVRRNHLIGPDGIGALITTTNGISALVCGLPYWLQTNPRYADGADQVARDLQHRELHDLTAEHELGITRIIPPPIILDSGPGYLPRSAWSIPATRFPRFEYCTHSNCHQLTQASPESPSRGWCSETSRHPKKARTQQVPIILACPDGHLDEVNFTSLVHRDVSCCADPQLVPPREQHHQAHNLLLGLRRYPCQAQSRGYWPLHWGATVASWLPQ